MEIIPLLEQGFQIRHASMNDLEFVQELLAGHYQDDYRWRFSGDYLRSSWQSPDRNLESDTWVVIAPDGQRAGFAEVEQRGQVRFSPTVCVHGNYCGLGIASYLLSVAEQWALGNSARAPTDAHIKLVTRASARNKAALRVLERAGFSIIQSYFQMGIELKEAPTTPVWAEGIVVRPYVAGQDECAVFEADEEALADERGHASSSFEEWSRRFLEYGDLNPALTFLACEGDEIAGLAINRYLGELGWINHIGTRRRWRRKGIARALLLHSFGEFYRRGTHKIGLNVDAQSLTGAHLLFEAAGMRPILTYHVYEKELRPGKMI